MAPEYILRVPRSDSEGGSVIINVTSSGNFPLDVKLLATEGESPYSTTIKHSRISKLRDRRSRVSDEEWEKILLSSLLHRRIQKSEMTSVEKLELIATIAGDVLALHFRNNISGFTQKLGEVLLKQDEDQEIDAISWCAKAVERSTDLEAEVQDLSEKYNEQSKTIEKLNQQLEELIEARRAHEDSLLEKFRELLNTKKSKIRDQQRLLAGAKVDPKHVAKVRNARQKSNSHTPPASRTGKRKAKAAATSSESSEDESFGRKAPTQKEDGDGSDQLNTPEASDQDATEDESDDDLESAPRHKTLPGRSQGVSDDVANHKDMQIDTPPPSRELPFDRPNAGRGTEDADGSEMVDKSTLNQEAGNEDEETDDDDEL